MQLPLAAARSPRKNIQDELGAVEDFQVQSLFQVAKLGGREVVVKDGEIGPGGARGGADLFDLAPPHERRRVRRRRTLHRDAHYLGASAGRQFVEFLKRLLGLQPVARAARARTPRGSPADQVGLF